ncbi:probable POL1-DNA-directed DNA polymerase alpha,180 KD subunit [Zygosaccharomyces bailii ISA1307]|nr:probable POL1-DNA-directed DNA polymerase alpha,180 KD subunit [Zygosaccharomyces bailii ISA1307]
MSTRAEKLKKLQKLQAARAGKVVVDEEEDDRLYDEIDEKEYRTMKYRQLLQDDFVEDDDGVGYVDRGVEEFAEYSSDEEMEDTVEEGKSKETKPKNVGNGRAIGDLLRVQRASTQLNKPKVKTLGIDEFDDILGEFENNPSPKSNLKVRHNATKAGSSPIHSGKRPVDRAAGNEYKRQKVDLEVSIDDNFEMNSSPLKQHVMRREHTDEMDDLLQNARQSPLAPKTSKEEICSTIEDDSDDDITFGRKTVRSVAAIRQVNISSKSNSPTSPFVTAPATPLARDTAIGGRKTPLHSSPEPLVLSQSKLSAEQVVDPQTNGLQMFWLDFCEVDNTLVLFGKIKALDGSMVSGMVQVNGVCRELYFLPRKGRSPDDIHREIIPLIMDKYGLDNIRAKPEKMKYAFELPDIPRESEYLKVLLPYNTPKNKFETIPSDLSSENFYHVFGGKSGIFESFVVQNRIMGPCWLEIKNGDFTSLQNASNCAVEFSVTKPQDIKPLDIKKIPELNGISLAIQTAMNVKENKQEIIALTVSSYKKINLDSPIPENLQPDEIVTLARPPNGSNFPLGLGNLAKQKLKGRVRLFNNEKTLLACFCAMLKVSDPDVIIGHRLESIHLDVLAHRMHDLNIPTFSALGRRARRTWPDRFGKNNSMNIFYIQELLSGRLLCDIANDMGQSLTPKCQTWDLSEMFEVACNKEHKSLDINYQNLQYQTDAETMTMALQENIKNSMIIAEVSFRIQLLSLTKQLTNLAGNAWSQTLRGTRAGRNEYILLHEFARNGFILPDKENTNNRGQQKRVSANRAEEDSTHATNSTSKKAKYQGGLVFEPEKGLHKNYVLVMDFNSLYPSIIQEFNICFTTVRRNLEDTDELPKVPSGDEDYGVLPRLLANLVQRRREVKRIMATETDPHKRTQCDIKQQALKLTANSMYGCLGYVNSRFYAKPLAMLVTNKGREILMNTRQLAESLDLTVVYGDTDSVMIDSNCDNYADAIKVGNNFKKLVNERYKLLEIDIDNVFRKLLLHAKKKYAALNVSLDMDGKERVVLEVKGLDMKRREYCPLSRDISIHVLNKVLSEGDSEKALLDVYEYLERLRNQIENNEIRIDKFKINTKLSKDPSAYPGGKNMPAVQVALRMRKVGRVVKAGAVITYVITKQDDSVGGNGAILTVAERARALNEVMIKGSELQPDPNYYLEKQIFAPVERLIGRIESFDIIRLSESLGLDSRRYISRDNGPDGNVNGPNSLQPLETTISDVERFKDAVPLEMNCPQCGQKFPFGGIVASKHYSMCYNGLQCKHCNHLFAPLQLTCQLERSIRSHISLYYAGWLECDDPTCSTVCRQISVFGKRCLNEGCTGVVHYRYSDKQLYNQLLYFDSLFDCEKNKNQGLKPLYHEGDADFPGETMTDSSVKALSEQNRDYLGIARGVVQKYLSDCGRRYVDMSVIFDFMTAAK